MRNESELGINKLAKEAVAEMRNNYGPRLATGLEPPDDMDLTIYDSGVYFGREIGEADKRDYYVGKPQGQDGHILVVGGTGSGKSTCIARPTHVTWKGAVVSIDIKGDFDGTKLSKRPVKEFSLSRDKGSYDPFYFMHHDDKNNLVQNARELAQAIIPLPNYVTDPFWIQSAQNILTAVLLHGFGKGWSFNETIEIIFTKPLHKLIALIDDEENNLDAKKFINPFSSEKKLSDSKMLMSIFTEMSNCLMVFSTDKKVQEAFTPSEDSIKWEDLVEHNICITIPEDRLDQYGSVVTLMLTQLIRSLERRFDKHSAEGHTLPPVLLLLDEFPRYGKLEVIANALSTLRSKGVTICLMIQSLAQLDAIYGERVRRIIVDNCQYKAILNVTDADSQKYFSDLVGTQKVIVPSISESYNPDTGKMIGFNRQLNGIREPFIYPHEFATLEDVVLLTPEGYCRVKKIHHNL